MGIVALGCIAFGLSKEEVQEILLQVAIYCVVPTAIYSCRNAQEAFNEMGI